MKPADIEGALDRSEPHRVLIRNGGWHGHPQQVLRMKPAWEGESATWVVSIYSTEGVHIHDMWVEAENILAVCTVPQQARVA